MKTAARNGKHGYSFGKRNVLRFDLNESREGFCRRGRRRSLHAEGQNTEKVLEPTSSGTRNLQDENIRSGVESRGWCVNLKTVTEIRRSSVVTQWPYAPSDCRDGRLAGLFRL